MANLSFRLKLRTRAGLPPLMRAFALPAATSPPRSPPAHPPPRAPPSPPDPTLLSLSLSLRCRIARARACVINAHTMQGKRSALHLAALKGHADCIFMLVNAGAEIDLTDEVCFAAARRRARTASRDSPRRRRRAAVDDDGNAPSPRPPPRSRTHTLPPSSRATVGPDSAAGRRRKRALPYRRHTPGARFETRRRDWRSESPIAERRRATFFSTTHTRARVCGGSSRGAARSCPAAPCVARARSLPTRRPRRHPLGALSPTDTAR